MISVWQFRFHLPAASRVKLTSLEKAAETYTHIRRLIKDKSYRETLWFLGTQRFWVRYRYIYLLGHRICFCPLKMIQTAMQARLKSQGRSIASFRSKMRGMPDNLQKMNNLQKPGSPWTYLSGRLWNNGCSDVKRWYPRNTLMNTKFLCDLFFCPRRLGSEASVICHRRKNLITQENCYVDQLLIFKTIWLAAHTHKHFILRFDVFVLPDGIHSKDREERSRIFPKLAKERVCNATVE